MKKVGHFIFFGGDGSFLSNFYTGPASVFTLKGTTFTSSEQAYQYTKAYVCKDKKLAMLVKKADSPLVIKRLSHELNCSEAIWETWISQRLVIMMEILRAKFSNPVMKEMLIQTKGCVLVEATGDKFWGCGLNQEDKNLAEPSQWTGRNWLGILLMNLRAELIREELEK